MNVFWHELRAMRLSGLWWLIGLLLTTLMFVSLYPSFTHDVEASRKLLESFPPELRAAIGLSTDSFFSFFGFYAYVFTYITLAGAVYSTYAGLTIYSKEDANKTTDFLFAKPISRSTIFSSKLAAISVMVLVVGVLLQIGTYVFARLFAGSVDGSLFLLFSGSLLLIQFCFMAIGVVVSIIVPRIKNTITLAIGIPFGFLVIGMIGSVIGDDVIRYITPFKYIDYQYVMQHHGYEMQYLVLGLGVMMACLVASYGMYRRRDTRAVA